MNQFVERKERLHERMRVLTKENIAVAFSGGVDSSLLLRLAVKYANENGTEVYAVTANTELHPSGDIKVARKVAEEMGAKHVVVEINELDEANIRDNPQDRCYRCKHFLFSKIKKTMQENGVYIILDGTNADDSKVYRPGIRALSELDIISPLADAEFTKEQVRKMAAEYGISVAKRPSTPCLATRFSYGTRLEIEDMKRVEDAENYLKTLGLYNVRVRVQGALARIEVDTEYMQNILNEREEIVAYFKKIGYDYITLDLEGFRSGSMDLHIQEKNT